MASALALGLAHLSALDLAPGELLRLAARTGYQSVSLRIAPAAPGSPQYPLKAGSAELCETLKICDGEGVRVSDIEIISLSPDFDVEAHRWMLEAGEAFGATGLCVTGDDDDRARISDSFAALCDAAAPHGIDVDLEYMRWRHVARLGDALEVITRASQPNGRVMLDLLHHSRAGGTIEELAAVPASALRQVQVSDGPAELPAGLDIIDEARGTRQIPGTGELPLAASLAVLRDAPVFSVEMPAHLSLPDMPIEDILIRSAAFLRETL
jgi:sugar phosphate isomerase/epimerase